MATETGTYVDRPGDHPPPARTDPADYAALNAVFGALLTGLVVATRDGAAKDDPISGPELIPIAAATFALAKVIAREKIGSWVREPFVEEEGQNGRRLRGRGMKRAVGELVTCSRCVGAWSALGIVGLRLSSPTAGRVVTSVLAASAANDWLQASFRLLSEQTNKVAG